MKQERNSRLEAPGQLAGGRSGVAAIARSVERQISGGLLKEGTYLPSVRAISTRFGCATLTAHRAMRLLTENGVVTAEPRRGYRVARGGAKLPRTELVAFLEESENYTEYLGEIYQIQMRTLQREAINRGWSVVLVPYQRQPLAGIAEQLDRIGATALIVQEIRTPFPRGLLEGIGGIGLPVVDLNSAQGIMGLDHVVRDEAQGAALAAEYLLRRGHRRIGWYGTLRGTDSARRRFAGAAEVLLREGLSIDAQGWHDIPDSIDPAVAREYLLQNRPTAVLALWQTAAQALVRAARELGLKPGKDLEIVGWTLEEGFDRHYTSAFPELQSACATVTWSMADVARMVLDRIEERHRKPDQPNVSVLLPMRLREPTEAGKRFQTGRTDHVSKQ
jgi:DNA-binding LacI/PurR family transcriptional regulator